MNTRYFLRRYKKGNSVVAILENETIIDAISIDDDDDDDADDYSYLKGQPLSAMERAAKRGRSCLREMEPHEIEDFKLYGVIKEVKKDAKE